MSYLSKDDLSTPTDWSIIDSENESGDNESGVNESIEIESGDNESPDNEYTDRKVNHLEKTNEIINPLVKFYDPTMINTPKLT